MEKEETKLSTLNTSTFPTTAKPACVWREVDLFSGTRSKQTISRGASTSPALQTANDEGVTH